MFDQLGMIPRLLTQLPKLREEMEKLQTRLSEVSAEGSSGAGMVTVRANGKFEILSCRLSEEAARLNDREMLEDLIKAATNQALLKARQLMAEEVSKVTSSLGLPAGLPLPGLG